MAWTDERVEFAKQKWGEGWSAGQIAKELGGVTRNGVIGKLHRLNLTSANKPRPLQPRAEKTLRVEVPPEIKPKRFKAPREPVIEEIEAIEDEPNEGLISFHDDIKTCHCRWPFGNPSDINSFRFCGRLRAGDNPPYCAEHARKAYQVRE